MLVAAQLAGVSRYKHIQIYMPVAAQLGRVFSYKYT